MWIVKAALGITPPPVQLLLGCWPHKQNCHGERESMQQSSGGNHAALQWGACQCDCGTLPRSVFWGANKLVRGFQPYFLTGFTTLSQAVVKLEVEVVGY